MSWVWVDGGGWSWVEVGNRFTKMLIKKHVAQSNEGTYLAIPHLDLGGNDVVHKFDSIRRSHLYI